MYKYLTESQIYLKYQTEIFLILITVSVWKCIVLVKWNNPSLYAIKWTIQTFVTKITWIAEMDKCENERYIQFLHCVWRTTHCINKVPIQFSWILNLLVFLSSVPRVKRLTLAGLSTRAAEIYGDDTAMILHARRNTRTCIQLHTVAYLHCTQLTFKPLNLCASLYSHE